MYTKLTGYAGLEPFVKRAVEQVVKDNTPPAK